MKNERELITNIYNYLRLHFSSIIFTDNLIFTLILIIGTVIKIAYFLISTMLSEKFDKTEPLKINKEEKFKVRGPD